jgi:hypothetical protein
MSTITESVASIPVRGEEGHVLEPYGCAAEAAVGEEQRWFTWIWSGWDSGQEFEWARGGFDI